MGRSWAGVTIDGVAHVVVRRGTQVVVVPTSFAALDGLHRDSSAILVASGPPAAESGVDAPYVVVQLADRIQIFDIETRQGDPTALRRGTSAVPLEPNEEVLAAAADDGGVELVLGGPDRTQRARLAGGRIRDRSDIAPWPATSASFIRGRALIVGEGGPDDATTSYLTEIGLPSQDLIAVATAGSGVRTYVAVVHRTDTGADYAIVQVGRRWRAARSLSSVPDDVAIVLDGPRVEVVTDGLGVEVHDATAEGDSREVVVDMTAHQRPLTAINHAGGNFERLVLRYARDDSKSGESLPEYHIPLPKDLRAQIAQTPLGLVPERSVVRRIDDPKPTWWRTPNELSRSLSVGIVNLLADPAEIDLVQPSLVSIEQPDTRPVGLKVMRFDIGADPDAMQYLAEGTNTLDVVYVVGHGRVRGRTPILASRDDAAALVQVTPGVMGEWFRRARTQLVVLRACASAQDTVDSWSFAALLHIEGVPIVVGFADAISTFQSGDHQTTLHRELISCLQQGRSVEEALTNARITATRVAAGPFDDIKKLVDEARRAHDVDEAVDYLAHHLRALWLRPITYMHGPDADGNGGDGVIGSLPQP